MGNVVNLIKAYNHEFDITQVEGQYKVKFGKKLHDGELYVGNIESTKKVGVKENGYTHIIHLEKPHDDDIEKTLGVKELFYNDFDDSSKENILRILPRCFDFMDKAFAENKDSKILIHCLAGISRSSSVCIAYIMREKKMKFFDIENAVKADRSCIQPNYGFTNQLRLFERNEFQLDEKVFLMGDYLTKDEDLRCRYLSEEEFLDLEKKTEK